MTTGNAMRVGVIGAGAWGAEAHIPGFQACDDVAIVAVCDVDAARAEQVAREKDVPRAYTSVEAMLAAEQLDVVSIATPTDTHQATAGAAIAAGLHVLCEKPLARTLPQARAMAAQALAAGVYTKLGFTMRYAPSMRRLKELVTEGFIGTPYLLEMMLQNGQFLSPEKPWHWKLSQAHAGAGVIVEYGIHGLDLARWVLGEVRRVCAAGRTIIPQRHRPESGEVIMIDVEDSCGWLMEFANGALAVCHAGWTTIGRAPGLEFRVYGSHGAVQVVLSDDLPGSEVLRVATAAEQCFEPAEIPARLATPIPSPIGWRRRFQHNLIQHFVNEIRRGGRREPDFTDGVRAQVLLEAVVTSMNEDRWVAPEPV
jgi:predicted dehydrogenase